VVCGDTNHGVQGFHKIKEVNLTQRDRGGAEIAERFDQAGAGVRGVPLDRGLKVVWS
jgi:hypothetical protein